MRPALPLLLSTLLLAASTGAHATVAFDPAITDPAIDAAHPTSNKQLLVPSHGEEMNALLMLASGEGAKPTVILLHGLPGNEQNLDLAQAIRRAGWNVLTLHYRGSWGSPGTFSIAHAVEDAAAALAHLRDPAIAGKYGIDTRRLVIAGHSMGGFAAAKVAANDDTLAGLVLIDAWNVGDDARSLHEHPDTRGEVVAGFDDLGHSLAGADPESLTAEIEHAPADWDLLTTAPRLAKLPVLSVWAGRGIKAQNVALADAIDDHAGHRLATAEFPTDHAFSDHRIALAKSIVGWLRKLPEKSS